ncbi:MAG: type VI secretion system-associated FHA domain protein TagH, partial [Burkholderiaceae bacterium]
ADTVAADALSPALANDRATRSSVFADLLRVATVERPATSRADFHADADAIDIVLGDGTGSQSRPDTGEPQAAPRGREAAIDELFEALYAGMVIAAPASAPKSAAQMQLVGALLRAAVEGALGLLAARGIAKHEFGAAHTLIQARENNPLKFAAGADDALSRLLQLPEHGFIAALPAVSETFDALRAHEVALLAAMRAALQAVVDRFDPAAVERDLADKGGVWESLLPGHHKARLWECYCEQHAELNRGIEDNLNALFAGAFNAAYEAQVERLTRKA